jgi:hypothetical protein
MRLRRFFDLKNSSTNTLKNLQNQTTIIKTDESNAFLWTKRPKARRNPSPRN